MKKIRVISLILIYIFISTTVSASILGPTLIDSYTVEIGPGTTSTHNQWYSDQEGVGQQTENYVTYKPNEFVEPILTHGDYLYGASTISTEVSKIRENGIVSLAGINADYFSLETGIPMSNIISEGKILTKSDGSQYGIGILEDNTAFMSKLIMYSTIFKEDGTAISINHINKLRQPYGIYMITGDFSDQTHNKTNGYDVILTDIEGEISVGSEITAIVESIDEYNGSVLIPENKIVITVDTNTSEEYVNAIKSLSVGEKIKITFGYEGDERWEDVKIGIGATGDVLIENGTVNTNFSAGAHPRTALGIKNDGSIILYTIDGRQKGYSYGVQLRSLAKRLEELGCVDAINLDGGGSTSYIVQLPGDEKTTLINKPSDGKLRAVSNFIFLKNNQKPTGILNKIILYPLTSYVLINNSIDITAKGIDSSFYPAEIKNLTYYTDEDTKSTIDKNGKFTALKNETATVYAKSGKITGSLDIVCVSKPTNIKVKNQKGSYVDTVNIKREESMNFTAEAFAGYNKLVASKDSFKWSCDEEIGTITEDGKFTATDNVQDISGKIYVTVGEATFDISVNVKGLDIVYNTIDINIDGEILNVDFNLSTGLEIDEKKIIIRADGKNIDFEYKDGVANAFIEDGMKKITVFATNSKGYSSFASETISDIEYENPFTDTNEHWAKDILSYMYSSKIINGEQTDEGLKFNPSKTMTRSEFAVMVTNYLNVDANEYSDIELPYDDVDKIPAWALNSFKVLYELEIIKGSDTNGKLYANPTDSITRAETVTIISRTLPDGLEKAEITAFDSEDIPSWFVDGFEILINLGAINGYEDGTILPIKSVTKSEAAKILYSIL